MAREALKSVQIADGGTCSKSVSDSVERRHGSTGVDRYGTCWWSQAASRGMSRGQL